MYVYSNITNDKDELIKLDWILPRLEKPIKLFNNQSNIENYIELIKTIPPQFYDIVAFYSAAKHVDSNLTKYVFALVICNLAKNQEETKSLLTIDISSFNKEDMNSYLIEGIILNEIKNKLKEID